MALKLTEKFAELRDRSRFSLGIETITVPNEIKIDGDRLLWDINGPCNQVRTRKDLVLEFADLVSASNDSVLKFAQKWGTLELCEHEKPATHNLIYAPTNVSEHFVPQANVFCCYPTGSERIEIWLNYARQCHTFLSIAERLHSGGKVRQEEWGVLVDDLDLSGGVIDVGPAFAEWLSNPARSEVQAFALGEFVNRWLELASVRPSFIWEDIKEPAHITFRTQSIGKLFAAIAIQLMLAINMSDGPAICSSCAKLYFPERQPRTGEAHYCLSCGRRAAVRDASRRYRQNKKLQPSKRHYRQRHSAQATSKKRTSR